MGKGIDLQPNEQIIMEGAANKQQSPISNKGGKLTLTNQRLVFIAHGFNFGSKFDAVPLSDLAFTKGGMITPWIMTSNKIEVVLRSGEKWKFVVTGKQKEEWKQKITAAVSNYSDNSVNNTGGSVGSNKYEDLAKLQKLKEDGILTEEEFQAEKGKILK